MCLAMLLAHSWLDHRVYRCDLRLAIDSTIYGLAGQGVGGSYFPHVIAKEEFHNNYADHCIQSLLKCIPSKVVWLLAN